MALALLWTAAPGQAGPAPSPKAPSRLRLAVYPKPGVTVPSRIAVFLAGYGIAPKEVVAIDRERPVLIIVDPSSYSRDALGLQLAHWGAALARSHSLETSASIRLGIAVLDGVLSEPIRASAAQSAFESVVSNYLSGSSQSDATHPGRTMDLIVNLLDKATAGGPADCILIGSDRALPDGTPGYLTDAIGRRISSRLQQTGSTLYGHLAGSGAFSELIANSGGRAFPWAEPPASVLAQVGEARASGLVVSVEPAQDMRLEGWLPVTIEPTGEPTGPGESNNRLRYARRAWWVRNGNPAPTTAAVLQSLELLARPGSADMVWREAVALDPWNPSALIAAARGALAAGDADRFREYSSRAIGSLPVTPATAAAYCDVALRAGHEAEARAAIDLLRTRGNLDQAAADRITADLLSAAGDYRAAAAAYERLVRSSRNPDPDLEADYGWVLLKQGKNDEAERHFAAARGAGSRNPRLLLGQSALAAAGGNGDKALELARSALAETPGNIDAIMQLATLQMRAGQWKDALVSLEAPLPAEASRPEIVLLRVEAEIGAGRIAQAANLLARATTGRPATPAVTSRTAELQLKVGMIEAAARTLESGATGAGDQAGALLLRAAGLRERRGEFGQALLDYRTALHADPQLSEELASHIEFLSALVGRANSGAPEKAAASSVPQEHAGLIVPGGKELLARSLGVDPAALNGPDAAERVFAHILERTPNDADFGNNPLAASVLASLKDFDALVRHLIKLKLIHPEQDLEKPVELAFPLVGPDVKLAKTAQFLSFFGVRYKAPARGNGVIELTTSQSRSAESRMRLLRNLGVDLLNRNAREIRLSLRSERMPLLLGTDVWRTEILEGVSQPDLLRSLLRSASALRLYVALARCPSALAQTLVQGGMAGQLLRFTRAISIYGPSLEFKDGSLILPGSSQAWESLLQTPSSNRAAFLSALLSRDQGRALLLYQALSRASGPVALYLTSPARFAEIYALLAYYDDSRLASPTGDTARQDLGRILRLASADDNGIYFEISPHITRAIAGPQTAVPERQAELKKGYIGLQTLAGLMARGPMPTPTLFTTPIDLIEFFDYLRRSRPELLADTSVAAFLRNPTQAALYLDLIWHVRADADLTARYVAYCRSLSEAGKGGWNSNKTRSSQAFFYLLSALCRERFLEAAQAHRILASALEDFGTGNESQFARKLAGLLSREILPAVSASVGDSSGPDPVLRALAGRSDAREIRFEGKDFEFDGPGYRLSRLSAAIKPQSVAPLTKILDAYRLLAELDSGDIRTAGQLQKLVKEIGSVHERPKVLASDSAGRIARADTEALRRRIDSAVRKGEMAAPVRDDLAAALHVELGVSLLNYCYADNATQDTTILAFDPNFVRGHSFYPETISQHGMWRRSYLIQDESGNSAMTGSLAGLRDELSRLETLQSGQSFGVQAAGLVPTLLSGIRGIPFAFRTDRAQEYVALSVRLGLELVLTAPRDPALRAWLLEEAQTMIGPHRQDLLLGWIAHPDSDAQVFSRSELFLLARSYLGAPDTAPVLKSPVLDELRRMTPQPGTPEAARFESEIEQYGPRQTSRSGIDQASFAFADPYETLETNVRVSVLLERICDLNIRIAELNYSMGLPATLAAFEAELALKDIVPENTELGVNSWRVALERIARLDSTSVRRWIEELGVRGCLHEKFVEQAETAAEVRRR